MDHSNHATRQLLREWQARNHWRWVDISNALREWGLANVPGGDRLELFASSGKHSMHTAGRVGLHRFLTRYPNPGTYEQVISRLQAEKAANWEAQRKKVENAAAQREAERQAHIDYWMSRERPADGRPARQQTQFIGLDKATVAALSGI